MFMNVHAPRKRLVWNAIPTIFDVPNPPKLDTGARKLPTPREPPPIPPPNVDEKVAKTLKYIEMEKKNMEMSKLVKSSSQMKKAKLLIKKKNDALRYLQHRKKKPSTMTKLETVFEVVSPLLTKDELTILKERLGKKSSKRKRYSEEFKDLVIRLSFKGASTYKYLSKRLNLPPKCTVSRWMSKIRFREGLDENLFSLLKLHMQNFEEKDRVGSLLMDEMSLKEGLDYDQSRDKIMGVKKKDNGSYTYPSSVLTFMLVGVRHKWKQVLSYHFCENSLPTVQLHRVFLQILEKVEQCGVKILNVTADQGSNFSGLFSKLCVTEKEPYFHYNQRKIFVTPDPPHLLKSARNALLDHKILTVDGEAQWSDIANFFSWDTRQMSRLAPKLTVQHIEPPPFFGRMSVSKAAQVLSHTVSCSLQTCVEKSILPKQAAATAKFCAMFDKIFDVLNSSRRFGRKPYKSALSPDNVKLLCFIPEAIQWLKTIRILDKDGKVINNRFRFLNGMILALSSVQQLMEHCCSQFDFDFLLTRRICQDPLENFFGIIRSRNGSNQNPTCLAFARACKLVLCN